MKFSTFMLLVVLVATPVLSAACDPAIEGCTACGADVTKCVQCSAGYRLTSADGTCTLCDAGKGKAEDAANPGADTTCDVTCSAECNICGATPTTCLACGDGYHSFLDADVKTCLPCSGGKGIAAEATPSTTDTTCALNCSPECNGCGAVTNVCLTCAVGHYSLMYNGNKICLSCGGGRGRAAETDPTTSKISTTCTVICAPQCQSCGGTRAACSSCSAGHYMSAANTCTACPAGFGKPADTANPMVSTTDGADECSATCDVSCNACYGSAADNCLNCNVNYNFDGISTCNICQDGKTKPKDTLIVPYATTSCYQNCHESCLTCKSNAGGDCKKCTASYWWAGAGSCSMCPEAFTKAADAAENPVGTSTSADCTIPCASNCKQCWSAAANNCYSCYAGYYRSSSSTCTMCPSGRGKGTDGSAIAYTASSDFHCTTTCHLSCRVCSNNSATGCLACKAGYYLSAAGTCSFCPIGTTRPQDDTFPPAPVADSTCTDKCHGSCKFCKGTTASDCMACSGGYYWAGSGVCAECPITKGRAPDSGENIGVGLSPITACGGINCNAACKVCQGTLPTDCNKCSAGHYMSAANTCTMCPAGFGKQVDATDTFPTISIDSGISECTVVCATGCRTCYGTQPTECLSCSAGYFYAGGNSCTPCATGRGKPADATVMTVGTTSDLGCTATCHASCLTCTGSTANDCVKCAAGFYLSAAGVCTMCPAGFGKLADATVLSPGGSDQCGVTCHANCRTCSTANADGCLACAAGLFYFGGGVCNPCAAGKGKPADATVMTVGTTSDAACLSTCHNLCSTCQGTGSTDCLSCKAGFYYSAANTCTMCPLGSGKGPDSPMPTVTTAAACTVPCHSSCNTCSMTGETGCINCNSGFWWAGAGACTACANGKTKGPDASFSLAASTEDAECTTTCNTGCQMCSGTDPTCVFCAATFYYSAAGVCSPCASGRGKAADSASNTPSDGSTICEACAPGCESCRGTGATDCVKCSAGYYLSAVGTCSLCPTGFGKIADATIPTAPSIDFGVSECGIPCDSSCRTCSATGASGCINCAAGFFWAGSGTCTQCNDNKGKLAHTGPPAAESADSCMVNCDSSCLICSASTPGSCVKCQQGYFLSAEGTCTMCPAGKGKLKDSDMPTIGTGDVLCTIPCNPSCRTCAGTGATDCLNCAGGYFWQGGGTCAQCGPDSGKPQDTAITTIPGDQTLCTADCDLSCSKCTGSTATDCLNCRSGYFLSAAGTCSLCPKGFGKTGDPEFPYPTATTDGAAACTIPCHESCRTCEGTAATDCIMCSASYWWQGAGTCTLCDVGKGLPAASFPLPIPGSADMCSNCHISCSKCKGTGATDCLNCKAGLYLASDGSCAVCPFGFGKTEDPLSPYPAASSDSGSAECGIVCNAKCATCSGTGETDCLSCAAGYFWAGAGVCTLCEPNTGKPADTTLPSAVGSAALCTANCHDSCSKCKGTGATDCLNCKAGYFLSAAGTCSMCPVGRGKLQDLELPYPAVNVDGAAVCTITCDSTCATCVGTADSDCLNCNSGYWWAGSGRCSTCLPGRGKSSDTAVVAAAASAAACTLNCDPSCKVCFGEAANECLSCKATYFKSAASVCSTCTSLKGKPADATTVTAPTTALAACTDTCHVSCAKCSGPTANDCVTCTAGYFYSASGVCSLCPTGKGKLFDSTLPTISTSAGVDECDIPCHQTCQTCMGTMQMQCMTCQPGRFWNDGQCQICPSGMGKPADANAFFAAETDTACTSQCHPSCLMCKGPAETDCLSCNAGYWWAGSGTCTACPVGRGKPSDTNLFPEAPSNAEACYIYCDVCTSGCKTCTSQPTVCSTCVTGRLFQEGTCLQCPDNCLTCSSTTTCTACEQNFVLSADGSMCSKCAVADCQSCEADINVCTKCNDKYTLKSSSECILTPTPTTPALTDLTTTTTPGLKMDILTDNLSFDLGPTESKTVSAIFVVDKLANRKYTCEELRCNHFSTSKGISVKFDSDVTIQQGKLTIERVDPTVAKKITGNVNKRVLLEAYPLVIDNFVLMGKSNLKTFSYVVKIIVSILRLPLSLLVFWKFPRWAMLMDFMVTHLKMYSLLGEPYMAFVEVVFQVVSDSKILPFNFDNPFEKWNPDTLTCSSRPALKSKNVQCSFFDNYGENIIGLASLAVLLLIIHYIGKYLSQRQGLSSKQRYLVDTLANGYGYQFFVAKLDANHLEIILFTIISYSTADDSSKSVVGIIFSTAALAGFLYLAGFLTWESVGVWNAKPLQRATASKNQRNQHMVVQDTENEGIGQRHGSPAEPNNPPVQITDKVSLPTAVIFAFAQSLFPQNKLSIWLHAGRYLRAVLLAIFVGVVKNPVEQIVLVIILESLYLAHLMLLDYRGTLYERITQLSFQGLILLHLIFRSIATSNGLSEEQIHSVLSTMIAVVLIVYIVAHIILALLSLAALFTGGNKEPQVNDKVQGKPQNMIEVVEQPGMARNDNESKHQPADPRSEMNFSYALPREEVQSPQNLSVRHPASYVDVDIPAEDKPERTIRPDNVQLGFVDSGPTGLAPIS